MDIQGAASGTQPSTPMLVFSRQPGNQEGEGDMHGSPGALGAGVPEALPDAGVLTLPCCRPSAGGLAPGTRHATGCFSCILLQRENLF